MSPHEREDLAIPVARVMSTQLVAVDEAATVADAAALMQQTGVGCAVVADEAGALAGIFTERDLLRVVGAGYDARATFVGEVMTRDVQTVERDTPLSAAADIVQEGGFRHLPVVQAGRVVGIVTMQDLFRVRLKLVESQLASEVRALRDARGLLALSEKERFAALMEINERLGQIALTDELTGLYNYRCFSKRLVEEVARANRLLAPLSLVFVDVDHLQELNQRRGLAAGDLVLRQLAAFLRDAVEGAGPLMRLRRSDIVTRYGGEEFAVLLLDTRAPGALIVAERIRAGVAAIPMAFEGGAATVTVSVGVASLPDHADDGDALISAAGQALARAKEQGRNRVELALSRFGAPAPAPPAPPAPAPRAPPAPARASPAEAAPSDELDFENV